MTSAAVVEQVVTFDCAESRLWGILTRPPADAVASGVAVLVVVGGPQYRVGSHRQFVLLARALASAGFPVLRFDSTGMGDSEGSVRHFDLIEPDLRAALDMLSQTCPDSSRIVVWGLCDAASAAFMFATNTPRVVGIVAANPWARSDESLAVARVKHYYAARLLHREFWRKFLRGGLHWGASLRSLMHNLSAAYISRRDGAIAPDRGSFQAAMARGFAAFHGRVLLIVSGNDLTAREFLDHARTSRMWDGLLDHPKVSRVELAEADHTFSRRDWLRTVEAETIAWLNRLPEPAGHAMNKKH